jgi:hypothetical protein
VLKSAAQPLAGVVLLWKSYAAGQAPLGGRMSRRETPPPVESHIARFRRLLEEQYLANPTDTGGSFGEILCHEIHETG